MTSSIERWSCDASRMMTRDRRLRAIVDLAILGGTDGHQIPGVHKLMRSLLDHRVRIAREIGTGGAECYGVAVLETTTIRTVFKLKSVFAVWHPAAEQCHGLVYHRLNSRHESDRIERGCVRQRPIGNAVRRPALHELPLTYSAGEYRGVYQRRGIRGGIPPLPLGASLLTLPSPRQHIPQAGCDLPAGRKIERHHEAGVSASEQIHKRVGPADEPAGRSEIGKP